MHMQLLVRVHSSQVCASTNAKEDLSSRTLIFYFPPCLTSARGVPSSHVYKGKETTEIQMATCGMLQSYQTLFLCGKYRKDDRLEEDNKWKVANSGAGKEKDKKKLGEGGREQSMNYSWVKSSLNPSVQWATPWIWERGYQRSLKVQDDKKVNMLLKVATKNVKSRKPVGDLQFVPHGFPATGRGKRGKSQWRMTEGEVMSSKKEKNRPECLRHRICRK